MAAFYEIHVKNGLIIPLDIIFGVKLCSRGKKTCIVWMIKFILLV